MTGITEHKDENQLDDGGYIWALYIPFPMDDDNDSYDDPNSVRWHADINDDDYNIGDDDDFDEEDDDNDEDLPELDEAFAEDEDDQSTCNHSFSTEEVKRAYANLSYVQKKLYSLNIFAKDKRLRINDLQKQNNDMKKEKEEVDQKSKKKNIVKSYSFPGTQSNNVSFIITALMIQRYIKENADDFLPMVKDTIPIEVDIDSVEDVASMGAYYFCIGKKIYRYSVDSRNYKNTIESEHPINHIIDAVLKKVEDENPLRNKHLQFIQTNGGLSWQIRKPPTTKFDNLIVEDRVKNLVQENTNFYIKHMPSNNGIILHGPPGAGKSLACQAIINEALADNFSTCFITTYVDFPALDEVIEKYLGVTILILEDIDSYAESREIHSNAALASFLQFMSGLTERKHRMIVVATTNYLDKLDDAIGNRPMRFNAKILFDYANENELSQLIDLYFGKDEVSQQDKKRCYSKKFTGSHIKALKERAEVIAKRYEIQGNNTNNTSAIFNEALDFIIEQFPASKHEVIGF